MGGQKTLIGLTRSKFRLRDFKIPLSNIMRNIDGAVEKSVAGKQIHDRSRGSRQEQESLVSYHLTLLIYHLPQRRHLNLNLAPAFIGK